MNDDIYETPNVGTDALYSNYVRQKKVWHFYIRHPCKMYEVWSTLYSVGANRLLVDLNILLILRIYCIYTEYIVFPKTA